jgi:hypothetical protein
MILFAGERVANVERFARENGIVEIAYDHGTADLSDNVCVASDE